MTSALEPSSAISCSRSARAQPFVRGEETTHAPFPKQLVPAGIEVDIQVGPFSMHVCKVPSQDGLDFLEPLHAHPRRIRQDKVEAAGPEHFEESIAPGAP